MDELQNAGVAIIAVVLILREVTAILKARRDEGRPDAKTEATEKYNALFKIVRETKQQVDALHACHLGPQALDEDGAPKWYNRSALPEAVESVGAAVSALNDTLREIHHDNRAIKEQLDRVEKQVGG